MRTGQYKFLAATLLCATALSAWAAEPNLKSMGLGSDEPINLTAQRATTRNVPGGIEFTFDRQVSLKQGNLVLTCEKLVVVHDDKPGKAGQEPEGNKLPKDAQSLKAIRSLTATGNVKLVQGEHMATAGKAQFDSTSRTITLTEGPPRLWQGKNGAVADTIIFFIDENRSELRGNDGGPIKITITPGK